MHGLQVTNGDQPSHTDVRNLGMAQPPIGFVISDALWSHLQPLRALSRGSMTLPEASLPLLFHANMLDLQPWFP